MKWLWLSALGLGGCYQSIGAGYVHRFAEHGGDGAEGYWQFTLGEDLHEDVIPGFLKTTVLAVAMALVGIAYYIVVVREAFTADEQPLEVQVTPLNGLVVLLCGIAVVALGVWPIQLP